MRTDPSLRGLVVAAQGGDKQAMAQLLSRVQPQIYRFGMRMCRQPSDAEDVLQDTLLTVASKLSQFNGNASLSTWAYAIARNHCLNKRRTNHRASALPRSVEGGEQRSEDNQERQLSDKQSWERLYAAMANLEPAQREVLVLRDVEGLSAAEVSEIVGVSVAAVKSKLHRARSALRRRLAPAPSSEHCPDVVDLFSKHLEDELTPAVCEKMQAHVQVCPQCKQVCDALREDLRICQSAASDPIPVPVRRRIEAALRRAW